MKTLKTCKMGCGKMKSGGPVKKIKKMQDGGPALKSTINRMGFPMSGSTGTNKYENSLMMKKGGSLKPVPSDKVGLSKLPTAVRNKMGYQKKGGTIKKGPLGTPLGNPLSYFNSQKGQKSAEPKQTLRRAQGGGGVEYTGLYGTPTLKERGIKNIYQGPLNEGDSKYADEQYPLTTKNGYGPIAVEYTGNNRIPGVGYNNLEYPTNFTKLQKQQAARERFENLARSNDPFIQKRNKKYGNLTGKNGIVKDEGTNIAWDDEDIDLHEARKNAEQGSFDRNTGIGQYLYKLSKGGSIKRKKK